MGRWIWNVLASPFWGTKRGQIRGWKSLDFLGFSRPNRAFSMGYGRFSAKFFSCPFLAARAARAGAAVRLAALVMTPVQSGGPLSLGSPPGILSFNPGPVVRWSPKPRYHEVVVGFWQENVGNSDSRIDVKGWIWPDAFAAIKAIAAG
jgi:hypothetical protein